MLIVSMVTVFITMGCATSIQVMDSEKIAIDGLLNQWHEEVAQYNFEAYFSKMTDDVVFVGTDATEVWNKKQFMDFSKPYFEKKQTWDFKPIQRNIYLDKNGKTAWFDEILNTWMGLCRGSGVVQKTLQGWKIQHYVLSVTVPNEAIQKVIEDKKQLEKEQLKLFLKG